MLDAVGGESLAFEGLVIIGPALAGGLGGPGACTVAVAGACVGLFLFLAAGSRHRHMIRVAAFNVLVFSFFAARSVHGSAVSSPGDYWLFTGAVVAPAAVSTFLWQTRKGLFLVAAGKSPDLLVRIGQNPWMARAIVFILVAAFSTFASALRFSSPVGAVGYGYCIYALARLTGSKQPMAGTAAAFLFAFLDQTFPFIRLWFALACLLCLMFLSNYVSFRALTPVKPGVRS